MNIIRITALTLVVTTGLYTGIVHPNASGKMIEEEPEPERSVESLEPEDAMQSIVLDNLDLQKFTYCEDDGSKSYFLRTDYDVPASDEIKKYVAVAAAKYGIEPELIFGVMKTESNYKEKVVSKDGHNFGLMQLNKITFSYFKEKIGADDPTDNEQNINCAAYMLATYLEKYKNLDFALMCYNKGEDGALRARKAGILTTKYCQSVKAEMKRIQASSGTYASGNLSVRSEKLAVKDGIPVENGAIS